MGSEQADLHWVGSLPAQQSTLMWWYPCHGNPPVQGVDAHTITMPALAATMESFCGQLFLGKFVVAAPRRPAKEDPGAVRKVRARRELVNLGGSLQSFETESFFPDPVGTRSETWPRRPRAGWLLERPKVRKVHAKSSGP